MTAALRHAITELLGLSPDDPLQKYRSLSEASKHSPDLGWLEQFEFQLLFCPDETQRSLPAHPLIEDSAFICHGFSRNLYNYWEQRVGVERLPIPMPGTPTLTRYFPPPLRLKGELHAVKPYQFRELDNYKENRYKFLRKRVKVLVPYRPILRRNVDTMGRKLPRALQGDKIILGTEHVYELKAWMYVGNPKYWDDLLDAGWNGFKIVSHYPSRRGWLKEYYSYSKFINESS